ncbi:hypothetical protein TUM4438_10660 [Shewanella sairae]|uniref:DUF1281 domain-containing protein n=1 Tax=Shewanella sairae TaxID=190310 RepID=A0ABQ4P5Z2_9GAMM|nr:DUF1281 domain-containing protein [Shewanella sairae]MCL1130499.1 DUF1281 domain-containing protein [Shewanella sairae]GIU42930.1 hypothetical protein TUM4438_10660 [Shewanella sairae]
MPNWCANRLAISGTVENISKLNGIFSGEQRLLHVQAIAASRKMFFAGVGGLLMPTSACVYTPFPDLIQGTGERTIANTAFTRWLDLLSHNVELTDDISLEIIELFRLTGLSNIVWGSINRTKRCKMKVLFNQKRFDWTGFFTQVNISDFWTALDVEASKSDYSLSSYFDMSLIIPPRLAVEINGFNGGLLSGVSSGYDDSCLRYDTKWRGADIDLVSSSAEGITIDYDTAWSPNLAVSEQISMLFNCSVTHYFAESGCAFCGCSIFNNGVLSNATCDELEYSDEENHDGYHDIVGPSYILNNMSHFGG